MAFAENIDSFKLSMTMLSFSFGIVFIIVGNILPKTRKNEIVGLRTNATMKNDQIWQKSNRFAGKVMVISGFCTVVSAFVFKGILSVIITTQRISPASAGGGFYLSAQSEYNLRLFGQRFYESPLLVKSRALNNTEL